MTGLNDRKRKKLSEEDFKPSYGNDGILLVIRPGFMLKDLKLVDMLYSATAMRRPIAAFGRKRQDLRTLAFETMTISLPSFRTTFLPKNYMGVGVIIVHLVVKQEPHATPPSSDDRHPSPCSHVAPRSYARRRLLAVDSYSASFPKLRGLSFPLTVLGRIDSKSPDTRIV